MSRELRKPLRLIMKSIKLLHKVRLQLQGAIYRPDSFLLMLRYYGNLKAIRYESTNLNRIVADKAHRVIVAFIVNEITITLCLSVLDT